MTVPIWCYKNASDFHSHPRVFYPRGVPIVFGLRDGFFRYAGISVLQSCDGKEHYEYDRANYFVTSSGLASKKSLGIKSNPCQTIGWAGQSSLLARCMNATRYQATTSASTIRSLFK